MHTFGMIREGVDTSEYVNRVQRVSFRNNSAFDVVVQIVTAMEYLHCHEFVIGDLSLDNILMILMKQLNGCHHVAKISDYSEFTQGKHTSAINFESFGRIAIQILVGEIVMEEVSGELEYSNELISFAFYVHKNSCDFSFSGICVKLRKINDEY